MRVGEMADVFVSYCDSDQPIAELIGGLLLRFGYSTWLYHRDSVPGRSHLETTRQEINACSGVIVLVSSKAFASDFVFPEILHAAAMRKPFLPILIDVSHERLEREKSRWITAFGFAVSVGWSHTENCLLQLVRGVQAITRTDPPDRLEIGLEVADFFRRYEQFAVTEHKHPEEFGRRVHRSADIEPITSPDSPPEPEPSASQTPSVHPHRPPMRPLSDRDQGREATLLNPFTPTHIASLPQDFFGRENEIQIMERAIAKGSVAIQGSVGIGKSSLLARVGLLMKEFSPHHRAITVTITANRDVTTIDDLARMMLEEFVVVDEEKNGIRVSLGQPHEFKSGDIRRCFSEQKYLSMMNKIIEKRLLPESTLLLLMVDEADKCPVPLARFIRSVVTHTQQRGITNVRFVVAGVNPYFREMVGEDPGVERFFYKTISLLPMHEEDAEDLIHTKLRLVVEDAERRQLELEIDPDVVENIVKLSGGHPHLLQLLGSHLVEHESQDPDGILDARDLVKSLQSICYEDRARVYEEAMHKLEIEEKLDPLRSLIALASSKCPTRIDRGLALDSVGKEILEWLVSHNYLMVVSGDMYGLTDEFMRVRMVMDEAIQEGEKEASYRELRLITSGTFDVTGEEWLDEDEEPIE
jgi:hypothetical protein